MSISILLVDDHGIMREGLRSLIEHREGMKIVGEASDGRAAVTLARQHRPEIIVLDVMLPDMNGVEAARQLLKKSPKSKLIALSMHSDTRLVAGMLQAGAKAYLLKDCSFDEMVRAIEAVADNKSYLSPEIAARVRSQFVTHGDGDGLHSALTVREREVLQLIAEGQSTREVARTLHVSVKTIELHRQQIKKKLGLESVAQLTKYAIREGLTTLES